MTTNPYAPPAAEVADIASPESEATAFFAVSLTKLFVMSLCTLLLYEIYWFYKHWQMIRSREGSNILPAARALFSIFFCYSLFKNISNEADRYGVHPLTGAGLLAIVWILISLTGYLPDWGSAISFLSVLILLPAQACANRVNAHVAPEHDPNAGFTIWNWVWILGGFLLIALTIYGYSLPEE